MKIDGFPQQPPEQLGGQSAKTEQEEPPVSATLAGLAEEPTHNSRLARRLGLHETRVQEGRLHHRSFHPSQHARNLPEEAQVLRRVPHQGAQGLQSVGGGDRTLQGEGLHLYAVRWD